MPTEPLPLRFISQFFPPERNAPANRAAALTRVLSRLTRVEVVTPLPSYPDPDQFSGIDIPSLDAALGIKVHRQATFRAHGGTLTRGAREVRLAASLVRTAMEGPIQSLWVSAPTMFLIPAAARIALARRVPVVVDLRDLTWEYASDSALTAGPIHRRLTALITREMESCLRRVPITLVTNDGAKSALIDAGVGEDKVFILPNGIDQQRLDDLADLPVPGEDADAGRFTVSYCGLVGHNQGLASLIEVAARMPAVDFVIAGGGPELLELKARAFRDGVKNLQFLGQVTWDEVKRVYARSSVLFAQLVAQGSLAGTAVPSKIFEYMATGRPIIYSGGGVAGETVERHGAGISVSGSADEICNAIERLASDKEWRCSMGSRGLATAPRYVRERLASKVLPEVLDRLGS